jgi:hypothetical protein
MPPTKASNTKVELDVEIHLKAKQTTNVVLLGL